MNKKLSTFGNKWHVQCVTTNSFTIVVCVCVCVTRGYTATSVLGYCSASISRIVSATHAATTRVSLALHEKE